MRKSASLGISLLVFGVSIGGGTASAATYYIDYSIGNNAYAGTTKASPWKCHPYMYYGTGTSCGSAPIYSHASGDNFIFKGGVTWPATALPLSLSAGGTSGSTDYYGADLTWYMGGSFTRPKLDAEFATRMANSTVVKLAGHLVFDNIEVTGLLLSNPGGTFGAGLIYLENVADVTIKNAHVHGWDYKKAAIASISRSNNVATVTTSTNHGLSQGNQCSVFEVTDTSFNGSQSASALGPNCVVASVIDSTHFTYNNIGNNTNSNGGYASPVYFNSDSGGIIGNYSAMKTDVVVEDSLIENSGYTMGGTALRMIYTIRNNVIHDLSSAIIYANTVYGNEIYNISYPKPCFILSSHTNTIFLAWGGESTPAPNNSKGYIYDNWIHDNQAAEGVYPTVGYGGSGGSANVHTIYVYNNVIHLRGANGISITSSGADANNVMNVYVWNNTVIQTGNAICWRLSNQTYPVTLLQIQNNLCITNGTVWDKSGNATVLVYDHQLTLSSVAAESEGYTFANKYAPTKKANSTVDAGVNTPQSLFTKDFLGRNRPKGLSWDIGAHEFGVDPPSGLHY